MFDIVPNALSTGLVLFATFASYKALLSASPAQLTPWLTYFLVLTLLTTAESTLSFITAYIPFYAWLRLFANLYLLLPGEQQGSLFLYANYIQPWIVRHDHEIERFIGEAHAKARTFGLGYVESAWEYISVKILGQTPAAPQSAPVAPPASTAYVGNLLSRFSLPTGVQTSLAGAAAEILQQAATGARDHAETTGRQVEGRYAEGRGPRRRESSGMRTSRSELEFDNISHEDAQGGGSGGASWGAWIGAAAGAVASGRKRE